MNPEKFSRKEIEQRITALLLGELPENEAALLRYTISQDAELAKLQERLKQTIDFTREAVRTPAEPAGTPSAPMKLSQERRKKLLAHFKLAPPRIVSPEEMGLKRFKISRVIEVLAVVAVLAVLAAMLLPALSAAKNKSRHAMAMDEAKQQAPKSEMARENPPATVVPMTPPAVATALPQPMPSAVIVLPKTKQSSADSVNSGVISARVVGYANTPTDFASAENSTLTVAAAQSETAPSSPFVSRYQSSVAGAGSLEDKSETTLQNRFSPAQPQPSASLSYNSPQGQFPATDEVAFDDRKLGMNAGSHLADVSGAWQLNQTKADGFNLSAQNLNEDKRAGEKTRGVTAGDTFALGDTPVTGRLFRSQTKSAMPLPGSTPAMPTESPLAPTLAPPEIYNGTLAKNSWQGESNLSDTTISGGLTLNGQNSFGNGTIANGGTLNLNQQKVETHTLAYNGVTKDDAAGLNYLITNSVELDRGGVGAGGGGGIGGMVTPVYEPKKILQTQKEATSEIGLGMPAPLAEDRPLPKISQPAPIPQPEILARENAFSTFSLNVSDVSFKLAAASLENGQLPDAASIRSEEFINAFDYRDPQAPPGVPVAFAWERARDPFAHNRDFLRFSIKVAAQGRDVNRPLNLVLLLDNSGSMERADRVQIIREALRVLATQLHAHDIVSVITFARTPRLWADGISGDKAGETLDKVGGITPEGGTNLEEAMNLAYQTALRHYLANGANRVVLLTDGAANLGNVNPDALKQKVETFRKQGVALDCFGIGWEDYNDDLLEALSSNGDGRYGFLNTPREAASGFATQLAGALKVAAQDMKVQVEFNPQRVTSWRQIGYAKHQLTKQQFRDNSVAAGEIAAQEAGNALYTIEVNPDGEGSIATVRVRYKIPGTDDFREQSWDVPYTGSATALEKASAAMRLCATAGEFSEWLAASPFAQEVTPDELLNELNGVPQVYNTDERPKKLEWMIRQAKSISGK